VRPRHARLLLTLLGLQSAACVALGYDFGDYGAASPGSAGSSEPAPGGSNDGPAATTAEGGADGVVASGQGGQGVAGSDDGPILTTFCAGGGPHVQASGASGASGGGSDEGGRGPKPECLPRDCWGAEAECGASDDGCGQPLDCGVCFWWFEACANNRCIIP